MKYRNYQIKLLLDILAYSFPAPVARSRNRFVKVLNERAEGIEKDRLEIIKEYANKDKNGELATKETEIDGKVVKSFDIPEKMMGSFNKAFTDLMNEEFTIAPDNSLKEEDITLVKGLIKGTQREMDVNEVEIYENILKGLDEKEVKSEVKEVK